MSKKSIAGREIEMKKYKVAVVGATGMVGRKMIEVLEERKFPVEQLFLFSSARSAGTLLPFGGQDCRVEELKETSFDDKGIEIALFSAGGDISRKYAPIAASKGAVVIDNSSAWRMDEKVPLVVPEVNPQAAASHQGIISNPNCSTIQSVVPLKGLHERFGIRRIVYSTYQSVSGSGVGGLEDLERGLRGEAPLKYPHPIAFNCLPHIDVFGPEGYTKEEIKMIEETRKILGDQTLRITATTVRVPVRYGHSVSMNLEFEKSFEMQEIFDCLRSAPGVVLVDDREEALYPTPLDAEGKDEVFVGRVRRDLSLENGINLWAVADNIRKGAATNSVQIAELLIRK